MAAINPYFTKEFERYFETKFEYFPRFNVT